MAAQVGHNALGSGQVVDQGARLVDIALEDGSAFSGDGFQFIKPALAEHTLHFIGLLSDGGACCTAIAKCPRFLWQLAWLSSCGGGPGPNQYALASQLRLYSNA